MLNIFIPNNIKKKAQLQLVVFILNYGKLIFQLNLNKKERNQVVF